MAPEVSTLPAEIEEVLLRVVRLLRSVGVAYQVGGSALLRLSGLDVPVNDLDIAVAAADREDSLRALVGWQLDSPPSHEPWRTDWLLRATPLDGESTASVDIMGGLALVIDGGVADFPMAVGKTVDIGGIEVELARLAHWYHLYRVHNPAKAALAASLLSDDEILAAADDLQIADTFSPTLIVRIRE